ncbi:MAG TPA: hypothetical protein VJ453_04150 [Terriglobales bacterium]|jgi:hypothetical protein|nr:hypothetical protein [Terriglobales bacterium]
MAIRSCSCGHSKRDHTILKSTTYGACKICLCNEYKIEAPALAASLPVTSKLVLS